MMTMIKNDDNDIDDNNDDYFEDATLKQEELSLSDRSTELEALSNANNIPVVKTEARFTSNNQSKTGQDMDSMSKLACQDDGHGFVGKTRNPWR